MSYEPPEHRELLKDIAEVMKDADFPDLKSVICEFMRIRGGAPGVARMLSREYNKAKTGSMVRSMILQMILQGAKAVGMKESSKDTGMMSEMDIDRKIQEYVDKAATANARTPGPKTEGAAQ